MEILNFFAAHPGQSYTLSELSKRLDINMASALSVLGALTDAGYLIRHPRHKTFVMGPGLVALGNSALSEHPALDLSRKEMPRISRERGTEVLASAVVGSEIVILAAEGRPRLPSSDVRIGQRLPLVPPIGEVFLAWSAPEQVDAWLSRLGPLADSEWVAHLGHALSVVRERGFSVTVETGARVALGQAVHELAEEPRDSRLQAAVRSWVVELGSDYELLAIDARRSYRVATIAAPVFSPAGEVSLAITLNGYEGVTGGELTGHAEALVAETRVLTRLSRGRAPVHQHDR